jgi:cytidylate kinase
MQPGELMVDREIARWRMSGVAADKITPPWVPAPLITISRELGSGGSEVAETLGARLHWPVYDREIVDEMVHQSHISRQLVLDLDESVANRALLWIGAMVTQEFFDYDDYLELLLRVLASLAQKGSAIILGRGANFVKRLGPRLDVRIIAPLEARIERLVRRDGISPHQAMLAIRHSDQSRRDFTQRVHQGHWDDASKYDLVINTGKLTVLEAAELVEDALKDLSRVAASPSA